MTYPGFAIRPTRALPFLGLLAALLLAAGAAHPQVSAAQKPRPPIKAADLAQRIHTRINAERAKNGLSPLAWDKALARIAAGHSRDMARRNTSATIPPKDTALRTAIAKRAILARSASAGPPTAGAENIALGNLYDSVTTVNGVARYDWNSSEKISGKAVEEWMKSTEHRKNILTPHWKHEGIGVEIAPDDKVYITQNYC